MAKRVTKQVLRNWELTTLLVALDHLEEYGPSAAIADPYESPAECAYLTYIGDAQLAALVARLPYRHVRFLTPSAGAAGKVVRTVFNKQALFHVIRFSFPKNTKALVFVRGLESVDRKYWTVLDAAGNPIKRPRDKTKGKG